MRIITVLFLCMFAVVSYSQTDNKYPCNENELQGIKMAILDYVIQNSAISSNDITILDEQCVSSYASATVHPIKPVTDDATVYLHQENNQWTVMNMGTDFDKEFLAKIPKELRLK